VESEVSAETRWPTGKEQGFVEGLELDVAEGWAYSMDTWGRGNCSGASARVHPQSRCRSSVWLRSSSQP
jgi:hypothetical protein